VLFPLRLSSSESEQQQQQQHAAAVMVKQKTAGPVYDVIVVGLGGHGSAAAAHLAKRGVKVLGLEKFPRASHAHGSSHGRSRIIRQAYFEDPRYVPLLIRAFELWRELEKSNKGPEPLLTMTGGLMIGTPSSDVITGSIASAKLHNLPYELLSAQQVRSRFPAFQLRDDEVGVFESEAGYLVPEACVETHMQVAAEHGATLLFEESLASWHEEEPGVVVVTTESGNKYRAKKVILSVGAWAEDIYAKDIKQVLPLHVVRRVLFWYEPSEAAAAAATNLFSKLPIYIWEIENGGSFYGFPLQLPGGIKVAMHDLDPKLKVATTIHTIDRQVSQGEKQTMTSLLQHRMPALAAMDITSTATCMYTNTPDEHFLIDWHPKCKHVLLASPCSGHGFKFCSVIGEILADLTSNVDGSSRHDAHISLFKIDGRPVMPVTPPTKQ